MFFLDDKLKAKLNLSKTETKRKYYICFSYDITGS